MAQFDVYRNPSPASGERFPYFLDVQSGLLDRISTRVVVPLCGPEVLGGKLAERLNPLFEIEGRAVTMLTPELAGIPLRALGSRVANISEQRNAIVAALDILVTGI